MKKQTPHLFSYNFLQVIALLVGLYFTSWYHYLLFHTLAEIYSIIIACTIFVIAVNSKQYLTNKYLHFIGIAYLFIGGLDLLHTLSYKGMNIFIDYDYYANQLWIATRFIESITLLIGFFFLKNPARFKEAWVYLVFVAVSAATILCIFTWKIFPVCFIDGQGLTAFKKNSEYILCVILMADIFLLYKFKDFFQPKIYRLIFWSFFFTIGSELAFTFYISNYGFSNLIGHYFKIFSFYLIYKAIIETGIREPYEIIFKELKENEKILAKLARTDPLTGIMNRRAFWEICRYEQLKIARTGRTNVLIMGDIDYFKKINDNFGHECGDMVIQEVAGVLRDNLRGNDSLCRWGGEEYLLLITECDADQACVIAEKLRVKIEELILTHKGRQFSVTMSFGTGFFTPGKSLEECIAEADKNLYKSKAAGRNVVTFASAQDSVDQEKI